MKYLIMNLKLVNKWRWVLVFILLLGLSFKTYSSIISYGVQPSLYELILSQTDSSSILTFYFIILILVMDIGFNKEDETEMKIGKSTSLVFHNFFYISFLCFAYELMIILINLLTLILLTGNIYLGNETITYANIKILSYLAMLVSLLFFFFRFTFITSLIYVINKQCKKIAFGYLGGLLICLTDAIIFNFGFENIYIVFPFGHSYLNSALRYSSSLLINIIINILYWVVLITIVGFIMFLIKRSNKKIKRGVFFETNHIQ